MYLASVFYPVVEKGASIVNYNIEEIKSAVMNMNYCINRKLNTSNSSLRGKLL